MFSCLLHRLAIVASQNGGSDMFTLIFRVTFAFVLPCLLIRVLFVFQVTLMV